jgi:DNA-directed RNA polymerase specialized sigma24 family protein
MGIGALNGREDNRAPAPGEAARRRRFGEYFPRLYAYVRSWVDSEAAARDIVVDVFTRVFAHKGDLTDAEFPVVLFGLARAVCNEGAGAARRGEAGLTRRERDVISLLFDAQLSRTEVGGLLEMDDRTVVASLVQGLKKLRAGLGARARPSLIAS